MFLLRHIALHGLRRSFLWQKNEGLRKQDLIKSQASCASILSAPGLPRRLSKLRFKAHA